ncbi:MAG: Xaa-Pro dipeptidyl-peptidase [Aureliella sp.]
MKDAKDWIQHDLWVETEFDSDGDGKLDRVHVDVTRPKQTDTEDLKVPVIYESSPYFAGTAGGGRDFFWNVNHELGEQPPERQFSPEIKLRKSKRPVISRTLVSEWVPRAFAVVHSSSPGTGLSQGCPTVGGENESLAPKAVVQWLCGKAKGYTEPDGDEQVTASWSTGKVGMIGTSYNGTLALAAAMTGVEGLEAIIPIAPNTSYYHYYRSNGLIRSPGGYEGEDIDVLYDFIHSGDRKNDEKCDCDVRDNLMLKKFDRVTGDYNDFWKGRDYIHQVDKIKAAVFMAHAFNDWNVVPEHSVRITEALKKRSDVPLMMYFHQGGHGGAPPKRLVNMWFTRYLRDVVNNVEEEPRGWVVRENDKRDKPTAYGDYPNPDSQHVALNLHPGAPRRGGLSTSSAVFSSPVATTESLVDNVSFDGGTLARAEWTNHRLIYVSPTLTKDLHISGIPKIKIKLASSKPAANLSVWLVSLPWNKASNAKITDNIITKGWADPQNHASIESSQPLTPGEFVTMSFDLQPDDQVIPAGQSIGLMIMSSDRESTLHPEPGTELTVDLAYTQLHLPVVGGEKSWEDAMPAPAK